MYQPQAKVVWVDPNEKPPKSEAEIMLESLRARRKEIFKDKESMYKYLKRIGVTFDKKGRMKVRPL